MKVFGNTQIFGIMGYPVEHSLSPIMHNAAFEALGIHAVYVPFSVKPEDLGKAAFSLKALGISGVNITIPHKGAAVIEFLDELDPSGQANGRGQYHCSKTASCMGTTPMLPGFCCRCTRTVILIPSEKQGRDPWGRWGRERGRDGAGRSGRQTHRDREPQ